MCVCAFGQGGGVAPLSVTHRNVVLFAPWELLEALPLN